MASITQQPAPLSITGIIGNPFSLLINFTSIITSAGASVAWNEITDYTAIVTDQYGNAIIGGLPSITSSADYELLIVWTTNQTSLISNSQGARWALEVTIEGSGPSSIIAGPLTFIPSTWPAASSSASVNLSVDVGTISVDLTLTLGGASGLTGLTSPDGSVVITNATGPVVGVSALGVSQAASVAAVGTSNAYAFGLTQAGSVGSNLYAFGITQAASIATEAYALTNAQSASTAAVATSLVTTQSASVNAATVSDPRGYAAAASIAAITNSFLTTQSASIATEAYALAQAQAASVVAASVSEAYTFGLTQVASVGSNTYSFSITNAASVAAETYALAQAQGASVNAVSVSEAYALAQSQAASVTAASVSEGYALATAQNASVNAVNISEAYAFGITHAASVALAADIPSPVVNAVEGLSGSVIFYSPNSSVTISTSGASVGFTASSGGGSVNSVFGRVGTVTAQSSDYAAFYDANGDASAASTAAISAAFTTTQSASTAAINVSEAYALAQSQAASVTSLAYTAAASIAAINASDPRGYASSASTAAIASAFLTTQSASTATISSAFLTTQSASVLSVAISEVYALAQAQAASVTTLAYVAAASTAAINASDPRGYASAASTAAIASAFLTTQSASIATLSAASVLSDPRGYASAASVAAISSAFLTTQSASVLAIATSEAYALAQAQAASITSVAYTSAASTLAISTSESYALAQVASVKSLALLSANNLSDVANTGTSRLDINIPVLTSVACVSTASVASLTGLPIVDGYQTVNGDSVLLVANGINNGPWLVPSSGSVGAWTRPTEFASGASVHGRTIGVLNGAVGANQQWILNTPTLGILVGVSSQIWSLTSTGLTALGYQQLGGAHSQKLQGWFANLGARNGQKVDIICCGDSVTEGMGATTLSQIWVQKLAQNLRNRFPLTASVVGGRGFIPPQLTSGLTSYSLSGIVTTSGSVTAIAEGLGINSRTYQLSAGASITYSLVGTAADIVWFGNSTSGSFGYKVDAGSVTTVSQAVGFGDGYITHVSLGAASAHTLTISFISAGTTGCNIDGVIEYNGDYTSGIQCHNAGWFGSDTAYWDGVSTDYFPTAWAGLAPGLIIIELGSNDVGAGLSAVQTQANLSTMISNIRTAFTAAAVTCPPILLMAAYPNQGHDAVWPSYVNGMYAIAAADPLIDVFDLTLRFPATDASQTWGLFYTDDTHPSNEGHQYIADALANFLSPA